MIDFSRESDNIVKFVIDNSVFNDVVITKALYWISGDFYVYQELFNNKYFIRLEKKRGNITDSCFDDLKNKINQDLIDFKTREIINRETKSIRDILYVKAFSNNDDFDDYNLLIEDELSR